MPVVTIRGQMGSGAPEIGKKVADRLHIDYVDRDIIAQVAERLRWSKQGIEAKETPPGTFLGRVAEALGSSSAYEGAYLPAWQIPLEDTRYLAGLESVIKELAESQSIVIMGRGSQFILKGKPGVLHVLVVTPFDIRVNRLAKIKSQDEETTKKEIEHFDRSYREFIKRYFQADLEETLHYDLVINTAYLSYEAATSIIVQAVPLKR